MSHILSSLDDTSSQAPRSAHECAALALSILNQRPHTTENIELAVMALRGASVDTLAAADRQMAGR